jgi:hypothetical protein
VRWPPSSAWQALVVPPHCRSASLTQHVAISSKCGDDRPARFKKSSFDYEHGASVAVRSPPDRYRAYTSSEHRCRRDVGLNYI